MNLSQAAEQSGISARMLRHYEAVGLLQPKRRDNGYRDYDEDDINILHKIKILNEAGMKLKDIHWLLPCFDLESQSFKLCRVATQLVENELNTIAEKLEQLQKSQALLHAFLERGKSLHQNKPPQSISTRD